MVYSEEMINPKPRLVTEDVRDSGVGSDADSEPSCPGTAAESPRPEAVHDDASSPDVSTRKHSDVDDSMIPATPGGTGVPNSQMHIPWIWLQ